MVLKDVPSNCTVVGIPGRIVRSKERFNPLEHGRLPDCEVEAIRILFEQIQLLEKQVAMLQERQRQTAAVVSAHQKAAERVPHCHSDESLLKVKEFLEGPEIESSGI